MTDSIVLSTASWPSLLASLRPGADEFYHGCEVGWANTLDAIKQYAARHR